MTIRRGDPFSDSASARDVIRQFRGPLAAGVTLWASGRAGSRRAGLTVSSLLVANGDPPRVLALLDPLADLVEVLGDTRRTAVTLLRHGDRRVAEVFARTVPAPGGLFRQAEFADQPWGPVLVGATSWVGLRLQQFEEVGWSVLATCTIEHVTVGEMGDPLVHYRGGYPRLAVDSAQR